MPMLRMPSASGRRLGPEPEDKYHAVYLAFILLGIGQLLPWNAFITERVYYAVRFHQAPFWPVVTDNFETVFSLSYQIFNFMALAFCVPKLGKMPMWSQITLPLVLMLVVMSLTVVLVPMKGVSGLLMTYLTVPSVMLLGAVGAVYSAGIFALAARFPAKYCQAIMIGCGWSALFASLMSLFTTVSNPPSKGAETPDSVEPAALGFFITATVVIGACLATYWCMGYLPFVRRFARSDPVHCSCLDLAALARRAEEGDSLQSLAQPLLAGYPSPRGASGLGRGAARHSGLHRSSSAGRLMGAGSAGRDSSQGRPGMQQQAAGAAAGAATGAGGAAGAGGAGAERGRRSGATVARGSVPMTPLGSSTVGGGGGGGGRSASGAGGRPSRPQQPRGAVGHPHDHGHGGGGGGHEGCPQCNPSAFAAHLVSEVAASHVASAAEAGTHALVNRGPEGQMPAVVAKVWVYGLAVAGTFTVTLSLFPTFTSSICSVRNPALAPPCAPHPEAGRLYGDLFTPLTFLVFSAFDLLGRFTSGLGRWGKEKPSPKWLLGWVAARVVLVPLLLMCNLVRETPLVLPVVFRSDLVAMGLIALMAITNGYLASVAMMHGPEMVRTHEKETAGAVMTLSLTLGLFSGSVVALLLDIALEKGATAHV